jgi:hypothetical protein
LKLNGRLAEAAVQLMKKHEPDDWQKLCNIIHARSRPWFHERPEIQDDPEKAVLFYLTSNKWLTDPPDWWGAVAFVNKLLETLFFAAQSGEITIIVGRGLETAELPRGRLCAARLGRNVWHLPFDLTTDQVECDGQKYDVVNIVCPADTPDPQAAEPAAPKDNGIPRRPALTRDLQARYNRRLTADHAPTRKDDVVIWAKAEKISQKRLWELRSTNPDKRLHTVGHPRKGATS